MQTAAWGYTKLSKKVNFSDIGETGVMPLTFVESRIFSIRYGFNWFLILLAFISVHQDLQKCLH